MKNPRQTALLAGACIFSQPPRKTNRAIPDPLQPEKAMDDCIRWASASPTIYPFYYIDPAAANAVDLVDMAVEKGFYGFKVIRNDGYPCDGKTLNVYRRIAQHGKPLTFHTGILWDGGDSSSFFRPALQRYLFGGDNSNRRAPTADGLPRPKIG